MIEIKVDEQPKQIVSIKVIGIGGAGGNAVEKIIKSGIQNIQCIVVNTDAQALETSMVPTKIQIGVKSAKGLGTGANPDLGKRAAEEDLDKIMEAVGSADIVFLAAGMGGGTGSGALPVIAHALREKGILTIAIITKPFIFEGKRRMNVAHEATEVVRKEVDTLIIMPNQNLLKVVDKNVSMIDAFDMINDVLMQSVKGISDIITHPGHINVDCADVRAIMKDQGVAVMGTGRAASGAGRGREAALQAISSPLLENMNIEGAHSVLLNITGGANLGLHEISDVASIIYEQAHEDANIILGSVIDDAMGDEISVTIIATGFKAKEKKEIDAKDDKAPSRNEQSQQEAVVRGSVLDAYGLGMKEASPVAAQEVVMQEAPAVVVQKVVQEVTQKGVQQEVKVEEPVIAQQAAAQKEVVLELDSPIAVAPEEVVLELASQIAAAPEENVLELVSHVAAAPEEVVLKLDSPIAAAPHAEEVVPQPAISLAKREMVTEYATHDIGYERCEVIQDLDVPTYLRKQQEERM
jgi:cell division protein FtsZ